MTDDSAHKTLDELIDAVDEIRTQLSAVVESVEQVRVPLNLRPTRAGLEQAGHLIAAELESLIVASQVIAQELPLASLPDNAKGLLTPPGVRMPTAPSTRQLGYMARLAANGLSTGNYRDLIERTGLPLPDTDGPAWPKVRSTLPISEDARYEYQQALSRAAHPIDCGPGSWLAAIDAQQCPRCGAEPGTRCLTNTNNPIELQDSHAGRIKPAHRLLGWTQA